MAGLAGGLIVQVLLLSALGTGPATLSSILVVLNRTGHHKDISTNSDYDIRTLVGHLKLFLAIILVLLNIDILSNSKLKLLRSVKWKV